MSRVTIQREAIREVIHTAEGPLLPEQILIRAQASCPGLGQATVYRAIKRLETEQEIQRITDPEGRARYERVKDHHHHFQCRSCDKVYDIPGCVMKPPSALRQKLPSGFQVESHEVWLHGLCATCA